MKKQRSTLNDVAHFAGVSYQTVSRVVNNHPSVSPETRTRVQQIIEEMGYQPNKLAKSLVANRSDTLAVLAFGMSQYGPTQMILNIERAARDLGYDLIFSNIKELNELEIYKAIDNISGRLVDGIIWISPVEGMSYNEMLRLAKNIPMVLIDPEVNEELPSVIVDQRYGSQLITEHLIELGHQHIAEISGPLDWFGAIARHQQWLQTLDEAGLTPMMSVEGDWSVQSGYEVARQLLRNNPGFTALVVGNDQMALGAIYALNERGLRVPEDISVAGFDDIPEAGFYRPPLTTIQQDFSQLGVLGVRYLSELIQNHEAPLKQHIIPPKLIVRKSTQPPS
jgi:DNA-binding LacI/PurR family transcriptional regulator